MKILLVTQYFWPESFGINYLVESLQAHGAEVTVLTGQPNYPDGKIYPGYSAFGSSATKYKNANVIRVPLAPRGSGSGVRLAINYFSYVFSGALIGAWRLRKEKEFDAIFVYANSPILQALPAIFISKLRKVPVSLWVQDLWPESLSATGFVKNKWLLKSVARLVRYIYDSSDSILIQSEAFREPIERLGIVSEKIQYYPNSIARPEKVPQRLAKNEAGLDQMKNGFSVVFAGNMGTAQSLETIIDAAELVQDKADIKIFFLGSGSMDQWLAREIQKRELSNVVLLGRVDQSEVAPFLQSATALLVTLRKDEIFARTIPSKVQSYLAAARPIIAALDGEGARVVASSGAGLSCPAENGGALADCMIEMYNKTDQERAQMGEAGAAYFDQNFELNKMTERLLELLQQTSRKAKFN